MVAEALVIVGIELEGGVQTAVAVFCVGTAGFAFCANLVNVLGVVPGHFRIRSHLIHTAGTGPVDTEVEVHAKVFEPVDLIIELCVANETVCSSFILLVVELSNRVAGCHGVHFAVGLSPDVISEKAGGSVVIDGLGGVVTESGTDGALVGVPVLCKSVLTVEVHAQVLLKEGGSEVEANGSTIHLGALEGTVLVGEAAGYAVRQGYSAECHVAVYAKVGVHGGSGVVDELLPVGVLGSEGVECRSGGEAVGNAFLHKGAHLVTGENVVVLGDGVHGGGHVNGDVGHAGCGSCLGTLLGGNHDNTVGCTGTVDSGCGCVLENGEALDILGVDGGQRIAHTGNAVVGYRQTVDDVQRIVGGVKRCAATDTDGGAGTGHTGTGSNHDARGLTPEEVGRGGDDTLVDFVGFNRCDGAGEVALLDGAVTDDDGIFKEKGVFGESDGARHLRGLEGLAGIADATDLYHCVRA